MNVKELCASCLRDNEKLTATLWCNSCLEPICEPCAKVHRKFSTPHKVTEMSKATKVYRSITSKCYLHIDQDADKYCMSHQEIVCEKCVSGSHITCNKVVSLEKAMTDMDSASKIQNLKDKMNILKEQYENMLKEVAKSREGLNKDQRMILDEIGKIREFVNTQLDDMEKGVLYLHRQHDQILEEGDKKLEFSNENLDANLDALGIIGNKFTDTRSFRSFKHIENIHNSDEQTMNNFFKDIKKNKLSMIPANFTRKLKDLFESLKETGYIDKSAKETGMPNTSRRISFDVKAASKVNTLSPTKGFVFGTCCFTEDSRIVLTEMKWDSKYKLCILDSKQGHSGRISISLPEEPNRLCPFEKFVLVTCKSKLTILMVDVQAITSDIKQIRPHTNSLLKEKIGSAECNFIFGKGSQIWVSIHCCTIQKDHVFICNVNLKGEIIRKVSIDPDVCDMSMNIRSESFIWSHHQNSTISETTMTGSEKLYCKAEDIKCSCLLTCDNSGGLFLAEPKSKYIYKFRFGEMRPVVQFEDDINNVDALNFNNRSNEMIVTTNGGENVQVYHVQL